MRVLCRHHEQKFPSIFKGMSCLLCYWKQKSKEGSWTMLDIVIFEKVCMPRKRPEIYEPRTSRPDSVTILRPIRSCGEIKAVFGSRCYINSCKNKNLQRFTVKLLYSYQRNVVVGNRWNRGPSGSFQPSSRDHWCHGSKNSPRSQEKDLFQS